METLEIHAAVLEQAVCESKERLLQVRCHAISGKGWVEVGTRRFVGHQYVQAAKHLHEQNKLEFKHTADNGRDTSSTYTLGNHACSRVRGQHVVS